VNPSLLVGKLAGHPRQNHLFVALREIGRIERSLFTLEWLQNPELRRRVTIGLNKGEAHHTLKRAIRFYRRGSVGDRTQLNQDLNAMALNLVVAAIILWNTAYLDHALHSYKRRYCGSGRHSATSLAFGLGAYRHHLSMERSGQGLGKVPTPSPGRHRVPEGQNRLAGYSCQVVQSGPVGA
jgi:hypothetical protein